MRSTGKARKHGEPVVPVTWLPVDDIIEYDRSVGRQHGKALASFPNRERFLLRHSQYVISRCLPYEGRLIDVSADDDVRDTDLLEQLTTPR
jgi:hypothetical protein